MDRSAASRHLSYYFYIHMRLDTSIWDFTLALIIRSRTSVREHMESTNNHACKCTPLREQSLQNYRLHLYHIEWIVYTSSSMIKDSDFQTMCFKGMSYGQSLFKSRKAGDWKKLFCEVIAQYSQTNPYWLNANQCTLKSTEEKLKLSHN
jgi:hypothetical protein